MKITGLSLAISSTLTVAYSQKNKSMQPRALTPARGHYQTAFRFQSTAKSTDEEIDKQKFQTSKENIERKAESQTIISKM